MSGATATDDAPAGDPIQVAFVCVQNAGRSQMAYAFAKGAREARNVGDRVEFLTGGTDPADHVHPEVVEVMAELDFDLAVRTPRAVTPEEIETCDIVITMGCSAEDVCPATWRGDARDWALVDPHGEDLDGVRTIRDEIADRVDGLLDELEVGARV